MIIAHITDLHFSKINFACMPLSKKFAGMVNLLLNRASFLNKAHLPLFLEKLSNNPHNQYSTINHFPQIDLLIVSGDISSTSSPQEFEAAKKFFNSPILKKIPTIFIPGNHDKYVKNSLFYSFFENNPNLPFQKQTSLYPNNTTKLPFAIIGSLKDDSIQLIKTKDITFILLDCAIKTSLFSSEGLFSKELEEKLLHYLPTIKEPNIVVVNHFPFTTNEPKRKRLKRCDDLKNILSQYPIKLYLHGHIHTSSITDLRTEKLPIVANPGSFADSFAPFNLIDINNSTPNPHISIKHLYIEKTPTIWTCKEKIFFF